MPADEARLWENKNAILARLTTASEIDYSGKLLGNMDFSRYSWMAFREAFEDKRPPKLPAATTPVRTACWWFIYSAERLWANVNIDNEQAPLWQAGVAEGSKYSPPWSEYDREIWAVWEQGLLTAHSTCTDLETKKVNAQACMNRATSNGHA